jgi:hypothetical protein
MATGGLPGNSAVDRAPATPPSMIPAAPAPANSTVGGLSPVAPPSGPQTPSRAPTPGPIPAVGTDPFPPPSGAAMSSPEQIQQVPGLPAHP